MMCTNPICAQYRMQHKNMTTRNIQLEKDTEEVRALHFNRTVAHSAVQQIRDMQTGAMGLLINGEVMNPDKVMKKMEIAAKCTSTLSAVEKINRSLMEENRVLQANYERTYAEMRRLQEVSAGFERPRRFKVFTDEKHRETLKLNEQLADELEKMERKVCRLQNDAKPRKKARRLDD